MFISCAFTAITQHFSTKRVALGATQTHTHIIFVTHVKLVESSHLHVPRCSIFWGRTRKYLLHMWSGLLVRWSSGTVFQNKHTPHFLQQRENLTDLLLSTTRYIERQCKANKSPTPRTDLFQRQPWVGFEPTTLCFRWERSTNWATSVWILKNHMHLRYQGNSAGRGLNLQHFFESLFVQIFNTTQQKANLKLLAVQGLTGRYNNIHICTLHSHFRGNCKRRGYTNHLSTVSRRW